MSPQMARPHRCSEIDDCVEQDMCTHSLRHIPEQAFFLGGLFPQHNSGNSDGAEDLGTKRIENNEDWGPRVYYGAEWYEGAFPLDTGESRLVTGLEKVERP